MSNCDSAAQHDVNRFSYKLGGHHVLLMDVAPIIKSTPPTMALHQPSTCYNLRTKANTCENQPEDISMTSCESLCEADHMQTRAAVVCPTRRELQSSQCTTCCSTPVPVCLWLKSKVLHCVSPVPARKQKAAVATEAKLADTPQTKHIPAFIPEGITLNRSRRPHQLSRLDPFT